MRLYYSWAGSNLGYVAAGHREVGLVLYIDICCLILQPSTIFFYACALNWLFCVCVQLEEYKPPKISFQATIMTVLCTRLLLAALILLAVLHAGWLLHDNV